MGTKTNESAAPAALKPGAQLLRRFEAPKEISPEAGVQVFSEERIQGVVQSDFIRGLLDSFGLQDRKEVSIPFQHMKRQHGELWRMRIEPAAMHTIDGKPVFGHQWLYERALPEQTAGQQ